MFSKYVVTNYAKVCKLFISNFISYNLCYLFLVITHLNGT